MADEQTREGLQALVDEHWDRHPNGEHTANCGCVSTAALEALKEQQATLASWEDLMESMGKSNGSMGIALRIGGPEARMELDIRHFDARGTIFETHAYRLRVTDAEERTLIDVLDDGPCEILDGITPKQIEFVLRQLGLVMAQANDHYVQEIQRLRKALDDVRIMAGPGCRPPPRSVAEDILVDIVCFVDDQGIDGPD